MKKTRVSLPGKSEIEQKQNRPSRQQRQTLSTTNPRTMKKNVSVKIVNTQSNKDQTTGEKHSEKNSAPITDVDLETQEQSTDEVEKKRNRHQCRM